MIRPLAFAVLASLLAVASAGHAFAEDAVGEGPHARVELVSERASVAAGEDAVFGLRFTTDPHWHIYWRHEGDSGMPPRATWTVEGEPQAAPFDWPAPTRFLVGGLAGFGYTGDIVLPVTLRVPGADSSGRTPTSLRVRAVVEWLVCEEGCVPGDASLTLEVPVTPAPGAPDPRVAPLFEAARALRPKPLPEGAGAVARGAPDHVEVTLRGRGPWSSPGASFTWFPLTPLAFAHAKDVTVRAGDDGVHLRLPLAPGRAAPPRLDGVLDVLAGTARAPFSIDLPVGPGSTSEEAPPPAEASPPPADASPPPTEAAAEPPKPSGALEIRSLWLALLFAFAGGLILNVMPCVLPVISLKVLGFVQQAGEDPRRIRRHGVSFAAGVLVSFWVLAGLLLGLRAAGEGLGWGFQFQEPGFTGALCLLMFAVGLNLLGVFEVGTRLAGRAGDATANAPGGYSGSFLSGVLATVVATPCTAPFMGPALAYALTVPAAVSFLVFSMLGVGMAAPYVVLSAFPTWLHRLPAPGRWMETFKEAMAFPMFAVVVGVGLVFGQQTGVLGLTWLLGALLALAVAAWLYGRFGGIDAVGVSKAVAGRALPLLFAAASVVALVVASGSDPEKESRPPEGWIAWRPGIEAELRAQGRPVFVDFTAAWCITCLANDKAVISTDAVRDAARRYGVAMVRADWTRKSPEIGAALAALGRASIPVYVVYPPDPSRPGEVLPTTITPGLVISAFARAAGTK